MRVFITGSDIGQLYWELMRTAPSTVSLCQPAEMLDITNREAVLQTVKALTPDVILNTAAYTAVDKAETETDIAQAVNADGVRYLAEAAVENGAHLVHVSTDFVFGSGNGTPFVESAAVAPVSVYGKTKLEAEQFLAQLMPDSSVVIRTAWVYSSHGNNFVKTMLKLMNDRDELGVIADQIGSPTWARSLAEALWRAADIRATGMLHWTGAGVASWYDFAVAIFEEATALGLLDREVRINPLRTDQYPTPAARPAYSVLELTRSWETLDMNAIHWREDLRSMLRELI